MNDKEKIAQEIESMLIYMKQDYDERDGLLLSNRITTLNIYLARSAELLADAQYYLDYEKGIASEQIDGDLSPTKFKFLIEAKTANEIRLAKLTERMNRAITHQLDNLRTQLSFIKTQM